MKKTVVVMMLFFLIAGIAVAQDVRYNFDKSIDFSKYKTYRWVMLKDAQKLSDLAEK